MKYLHTMIRVKDIDESLKFFCDGLGLKETRRMENEKGRFTLVFLAAPNDEKAEIEYIFVNPLFRRNGLAKKLLKIVKQKTNIKPKPQNPISPLGEKLFNINN